MGVTARRLLAATFALVFGVGGVFGGATSATAQETDPSEIAFREIQECLGGNDHLVVSLAVDESLSLKGTNGSDPDALRADLLASVVTALGDLAETTGTRVDVAVSTFAQDYNGDRSGAPLIDWRTLDRDVASRTADEIRSKITNDNLKEFTNHPEALAGIRRDIAAAPADGTDGSVPCRIGILFTDGALDVADGADEDAINQAAAAEMCRPGGIVDQVRRDQINLITIGLFDNPNDPETQQGRDLLRAMAEGSGPFTCGEYPIPPGYKHGAYEEGSIDALSVLVAALLAQSAGGTSIGTAPGSPTSFAVDPGIATVSVIGSAPQGIELRRPDGSSTNLQPGEQPQDASLSASWVQNTVDLRAAVGSDGVGEWTVSRPGQTDQIKVYFFTGLSIQPSDDLRLIAGEQSAVTGAVVSQGGAAPVDLGVYSSSSLQVTSADGTVGQAQIQPDGSFTVPFTAASGITTARVDFQLNLTTANGQVLDPVVAALTLPVSLPDEFPAVTPAELVLSSLEGADGVASGTLTIAGSEKGPSSACVGPMAWDDAAAASRYAATIAEQECFDLQPGEERTIPVDVTTNDPADETVTASIPVVLTGAPVGGQSAETSIDVPVTFSAIRPVNTAATAISVLIIIVLITLLHLAALWGVGLLLARFRPPDGPVSQGTIPVRIRSTASSASIKLEDDRPRTNAYPLEGGRSFNGPDGSTFSAEAPPLLNPFRSPQASVMAPEFTRVFSTYRESTTDAGRRAPVSLAVGSTVYVTVSDAHLVQGDAEFPGRLSFILTGADAGRDPATVIREKTAELGPRLPAALSHMAQGAKADSAQPEPEPIDVVGPPGPGPNLPGPGKKPPGPGPTIPGALKKPPGPGPSSTGRPPGPGSVPPSGPARPPGPGSVPPSGPARPPGPGSVPPSGPARPPGPGSVPPSGPGRPPGPA